MKIMLVETLGDGGIAHYTYNLATSLSKNHYSVYLFTTSDYEFKDKTVPFKQFALMFYFSNLLSQIFPYLNNEKKIPSILRRMIKLLEYPFNAFQALRIARKNGIKLLHLQSVNWIEVFIAILFKVFGCKIVYTIHNVIPHHKKLRFHHRLIFPVLYKLCDELIIHSETGKKEIIDLFNVSKEKISVIPHGDYDFFVPNKELSTGEAKKQIGIPENNTIVLFFGAIRPNKGLDRAIEAFSLVANYRKDARLMIVGELWEDFERYESLIKKYNLKEKIYTYFGYVANEDVHKYFYASDIVLLPYYEITGSGVLQIAYAFSKPVIASALECFKETIEDGKNGYLIADNDYKQFALRISEILDDNEKKQAMGQYSKFLSETKCSWDMIAKKTSKVYTSID